ncbi:hypothetical protein ABW20_dc0101005 [Dactylellina cionopaga]|nr:hypothetical protein ABW20_dc0101005 [Dactylellina cionopaga]
MPDQTLTDLIDWVDPFVDSLNLSTRPQACVSLLFQFLQRLQDNRFPIEARQSCIGVGLKVLDKTLDLFLGKDFGLDEAQHQGNRIIIRETIAIASSHLQILLKSLSHGNSGDRQTSLRIFHSILRIECRIFKTDFKTLLHDNNLTPSAIVYSPNIWEGLYDKFPNDDFDYARMILSGVSELANLEKLVTKGDPMNEPARLEFNKSLSHIKTSCANFFNRVSEYDAIVLKRLFSDKDASAALVSSLFDPYQENYHASADILKQAFGTLEKLKALMGLLTEYFHQSLIALDHAITHLRDFRTFGPMPRFLKTCDNILEIFCCPRSGLLTLKKVQISQTHKLLLRQYWNNQWSTLGFIFDNAIKWSQVYEKETMVEFTRDVMDYAGKLFSELGVFERALLDPGESVTIDLDASKDDQVSDDGRQLLAKVSAILSRVASWLRLRDETLLGMCQLLLCQMLKKFHHAGVTPESDALDVCQNMAVGVRKKYITNLTDQQKVELRLAVALHRPTDLTEEDREEDPQLKDEPEAIVEPLAKRPRTAPINLETWINKPKDMGGMADARQGRTNDQKTFSVETPTKRETTSSTKRVPKSSTVGGSSLLKSLKSDVRNDIRARNAVQSAGSSKSITSTEGVKLKSLNALMIPQVDKGPKIVQEDDSSSSDDQEDIGNDVFSIPKSIKPTEKPKGPRRTEFIGGSTIFTRGVPLGDPGPRQAQSAADIRARLTPNLTPLFRSILSWNFFHKGDIPPNSTKTDYTMVTQSFRNAKEYAETFEPLLLLECWQQIVTAREEAQTSSVFDIKVVTRAFVPVVVRLGRLDVINQAVHDVALENLVENKINSQKVNEDDKANTKPKTLEELRPQMNALVLEKKEKWAAIDQARSEQREPPLGLREELNTLTRKIKDLGRELDELRDKAPMVNRNNDIRRREFMQQVLDEAHILCATLSGAGHDTLKNLNVEFETVVIDEAAQSIELSALIPLKFGWITAYHNHSQPPTVLSREASKFAYEQSLFVRMQKNHPEAIHLLSIQYRMHPAISLFPSQVFYNSQLDNAPDMELLRSQPWHQSLFFGPYRFFNVLGQEAMSGHSMKNTHEVNVSLLIYQRLIADFPETNFDEKIGIITPYKTQLQALRQKFVERYGEQILKTIEFNTTDAFQGREREIIIFSCVRASQKSTVGFLSDIRRMNVGLTRARSSLFVLGNAQTLGKNEFWARLVDDARDRSCYTEGNFEQLMKRPCRTTIKQIEKRLSGVSISQSTTMVPPQPTKSTSVSEFRDLKSSTKTESKIETYESPRDLVKYEDSGKPSFEHPIREEPLGIAIDHPVQNSKKRHHHDEVKPPLIPANTEMDRLRIQTLAPPSQATVAPAQQRRPVLGSKGPLPKKKRNVEDAMFIKRKPPRP